MQVMMQVHPEGAVKLKKLERLTLCR
jgi:hypothetical protein